ncbi:MAG TPA: ABC transporter ATP-binding protein [Acidimicrobiales bacterium]|nr:ABC transporter ATP-binding protein [Acidimicrobiales bacterium]
MASAVGLEAVEKRYGASTLALSSLTLRAEAGELLVLLGPSGCGKSTALRIVAGLERPTSGTVRIGERIVNDVEPKDRDVAMVFQSYALYPHLTVRKNMEFPLRSRRVPAAERERRVREAARALHLEDLLDRRPAQLSGGQRQRVALARAIVRDPAVYLMDEPLSNLDARLRVEMRAELIELHRRSGTTIVYVTHDQVEAMTMGDRVAILREGVLQQVGTPAEVHDRPANSFVASFIGSPPMNLLPGELLGEPGVTAGVRPEDLAIEPGGPVAARVSLVESLGHEHHVACRIGGDGGPLAIVRIPAAGRPPLPGDEVRLGVRGALHRFDPATGERVGR